MAERDLSLSSFMVGISDAYLADIGRVVAGWGHVEAWFDVLAYREVRRDGEASTAHVSLGKPFGTRVNEFRKRLAKYNLASDKAKRVEAILTSLVVTKRERDDVAHTMWSPQIIESGPGSIAMSPDTAISVFQKLRSASPSTSMTPTHQKALQDLFQKIHGLFWDLNSLLLEI